jgi:hypothetical protein
MISLPAADQPLNTAVPRGLAVPKVLLPAANLDLGRWSVVACDQYTAQPDYWQQTEAIVGDAPSTLRLILPEYYLEHPAACSTEARVRAINQTMQRYLAEGILRQLPPGCVLVDRRTPRHASRLGLVLAIDLDCYDFVPGNRQLIRATEGTVLERIPPRAAIRRDAPLELPHVQVLIDDPDCQVIEPLALALRAGDESLYETELMQHGGSVRAWFIPSTAPLLHQAWRALERLNSLRAYGLLMAVGDGNHSLATAKAHWQALRDSVAPDHPARYALVEVVNLHDPGLAFEPIHRIVAGVAPETFLDEARTWFAKEDCAILEPGQSELPPGAHRIPILTASGRSDLILSRPSSPLAVASLQPFLDDLVRRTGARMDYIHGASVVRELAAAGQIGLLLPVLDKERLFPTIASDGILPRKAFSMGEANEKRYYMECRRIC